MPAFATISGDPGGSLQPMFFAVDTWHVLIGDPTYADAVLDRLVDNAHRLDLIGESLRRTPSSARKT